MSGLTKQAKILNPKLISTALSYLENTRHPIRNKLIFLLSAKGGMRAKEIACITWSMITGADGQLLNHFNLENTAAKGNSGRVIPVAKELKELLQTYRNISKHIDSHDRIIQTERSNRVLPQTIVNMFSSWYKDLGFDGCSSHSGRRTFITRGARKISTVGGSLRDIQYLAGHSSLATTQKYIEGDTEAQRKLIEMM
jgi:integrase/recombinase XerD